MLDSSNDVTLLAFMHIAQQFQNGIALRNDILDLAFIMTRMSQLTSIVGN